MKLVDQLFDSNVYHQLIWINEISQLITIRLKLGTDNSISLRNCSCFSILN
jgi:hypothetical protein